MATEAAKKDVVLLNSKRDGTSKRMEGETVAETEPESGTETKAEPETHPKKDDNSDIEFILKDIGNNCNRFQLYNRLSYLLAMTVAGIVVMTYVFTALRVEHRYVFGVLLMDCMQIA